MLESPHALGIPTVPLNVILLAPFVAPKFVPVTVTASVTWPLPGVTDISVGAGRTVKLTPLLSTPLARTTRFPVVAPTGTAAAILVALHVVTVAVVPLSLTVLVPWVAPKAAPAIVTDAPTTPDEGVSVVMLGAGTTVKLVPLLGTPATATTTLPVAAPTGTVATMLVALHVVTVAVVVLNLTVLVPCVVPKFEPAIVTDAPMAPDAGVSVVMLGVGSTVKLLPVLSTPLAWTTTFPVAAPAGTVVTILVAPHVVTVAVVPLNVTVPVP
jgi:hypothetical protein